MQQQAKPDLKTCSKCGIEWPATLEYFYRKGPVEKHKMEPSCKVCVRERHLTRERNNGRLPPGTVMASDRVVVFSRDAVHKGICPTMKMTVNEYTRRIVNRPEPSRKFT
jgi:hypothetical protein